MSYLVLARKYRPQTFDEIVGQPHITRTLKSAIASGRIAHSYLFTGTRGVGKTTVARVLAKALNCETGPTATPCNTCRNCVEITRGSSVDVFEIDGASNTGVDDVRDLRENIKYLPQGSRHRIVIIDEVHMLSTSAFNALLKTLEEPPAHVVFMFATTEVHKIPDTILSRCQQYDFKMIGLRDIHEYLRRVVEAEKLKMNDDALVLIARKAEGSMRDALSYLDQALSFAGEGITTAELTDILGILDRRLLMSLSDAVLGGRTDEAVDILEKLSVVAWDVKAFYGDLLEHFRNLVVAKISKRPETMINATSDELAELVRQAGGATYETLENLFSILVDAEEEVLRSGHPRLVLEMVLIRLATARPVTALDDLARELGRIRAMLAKGGAMPTGSAPRSVPQGAPPRPPSSPPTSSPPRTRMAAPDEPAQVVAKSSNGTTGLNGAAKSAPAIPDGATPVERFRATLRARDFKLSALLGRGSVDVKDNLVVLGIPKGLHFDEVTSEKRVLEEMVTEVFGDAAKLVIEALDQPGKVSPLAVPTPSTASARASRERRKTELLKLAAQNTTVQQLRGAFPGADLTVEEKS